MKGIDDAMEIDYVAMTSYFLNKQSLIGKNVFSFL